MQLEWNYIVIFGCSNFILIYWNGDCNHHQLLLFHKRNTCCGYGSIFDIESWTILPVIIIKSKIIARLIASKVMSMSSTTSLWRILYPFTCRSYASLMCNLILTAHVWFCCYMHIRCEQVYQSRKQYQIAKEASHSVGFQIIISRQNRRVHTMNRKIYYLI